MAKQAKPRGKCIWHISANMIRPRYIDNECYLGRWGPRTHAKAHPYRRKWLQMTHLVAEVQSKEGSKVEQCVETQLGGIWSAVAARAIGILHPCWRHQPTSGDGLGRP